MIRDKTKIYGEPNDPNTVLLEGNITGENLMIGAGGRKIKEFVVPNKSLIITGSGTSGNHDLKAFNYNLANKIIGTDANGDLVLKDQTKTIIKNFGGTNNQFDTSTFKLYDISGNDITDKFVWDTTVLSSSENISIITLARKDGETLTIKDIWKFDIMLPLDKQFVCNSSEILINIAGSLCSSSPTDQPGIIQNKYILYSEPSSSEIKEIGQNMTLFQNFQMNTTLSIPKGSTIKGFRFSNTLPDSNTSLIFNLSIMLIYTEGGA